MAVSVPAMIVIVIAAVGAGAAAGCWFALRRRRPAPEPSSGVGAILVPFTGPEVSRRAFDAAVRLAKAEGATIIPAFLARVPRHLPLDSPLLAQCSYGLPLIEAAEQRAAAQGIAVDSRIARGRTYRDALRRLLEDEAFDRVVVSATHGRRTGLSDGDLEWLLQRAPAEVLILRPAPDDLTGIPGAGLAAHSEVASADRRNGQLPADEESGSMAAIEVVVGPA